MKGYSTYLWLYQYQIDEKHNEIMLDIFVGKVLAARTLCEPHAFTECLIVGFTVRGVQRTDWISAFDTDWHRVYWS